MLVFFGIEDGLVVIGGIYGKMIFKEYKIAGSHLFGIKVLQTEVAVIRWDIVELAS